MDLFNSFHILVDFEHFFLAIWGGCLGNELSKCLSSFCSLSFSVLSTSSNHLKGQKAKVLALCKLRSQPGIVSSLPKKKQLRVWCQECLMPEVSRAAFTSYQCAVLNLLEWFLWTTFFWTFQQLGENYIEDGNIYFKSDFESTTELLKLR